MEVKRMSTPLTNLTTQCQCTCLIRLASSVMADEFDERRIRRERERYVDSKTTNRPIFDSSQVGSQFCALPPVTPSTISTCSVTIFLTFSRFSPHFWRLDCGSSSYYWARGKFIQSIILYPGILYVFLHFRVRLRAYA